VGQAASKLSVAEGLGIRVENRKAALQTPVEKLGWYRKMEICRDAVDILTELRYYNGVKE
jgi:hypothetical protein